MSWFPRLWGAEKKDFTAEVPLEEFLRVAGGMGFDSKSGITVNAMKALRCVTVWACARRIAECVTVPRKVYRKEGDRRIAVDDHPVARILRVEPNSQQSAFEYLETMAYHLFLRGNAFSLKTTVRGDLDELIPLAPERITIDQDEYLGVKKYRYFLPNGGGYEEFGPDEVWHIRGPSWNSTLGLDSVHLLNEAIALSLAAEETHAKQHAGNLKRSGLLSVDKPLNDTQLVRLAAFAKAQYATILRTGGLMVQGNDAKYSTMDMSGVDAQHLELRAYQVEEVCRGAGVLPVMVGHTDKAATYASSEQMFLAHLVHTVRPVQQRVEESMDRWLFSKKERAEGYYVDFKEEAFLSPAMKDKAEYRKIALGGGGAPGWMTPEEVRIQDEMDPVPTIGKLYAPVNTGPVDESGIPQAQKQDTQVPNVPAQ